VYLDGSTWYPEAYNILAPKHNLHSPYENRLIRYRKSKQYIKDRIEGFDDYYPCTVNRERNCDPDHINNWVYFFGSMYNDIKNHKFKINLGVENIIFNRAILLVLLPVFLR